MNDCMTQEDAMNMNNAQAIQILNPMQKMMIDQHGCPVSDAYFALGKAIESLKTNADVVEVVRCEDCINGEPEGDDSDFIICHYKGGERNMYDFYCKYGEKVEA